jgi:hypothetical protein
MTLNFQIREGSRPEQTFYDTNVQGTLDVLKAWQSYGTLFVWHRNQWMLVNDPLQIDQLLLNSDNADSLLYFWKDMPLILPRAAFVESSLEAVKSFKEAAQDWFVQGLNMGHNAVNDFITSLNCTLPQVYSEPPVVPSPELELPPLIPEPSTTRQNDLWEKLWADWASNSVHAPVDLPNLSTLLRQEAPEPPQLADISQPLSDSSFIRLSSDEQLDQSIAVELQQQIPSPQLTVSPEINDLIDQHQESIRHLQTMQFSQQEIVNAVRILRVAEVRGQIVPLIELLDKIL